MSFVRRLTWIVPHATRRLDPMSLMLKNELKGAQGGRRPSNTTPARCCLWS